MLAGMSVDYVVRLEQGRSSQPSTQLLGALAQAHEQAVPGLHNGSGEHEARAAVMKRPAAR